MTSNEIRIMVVDDHPLMREGLCAMLNKQTDMNVVAQAESGYQAIELFKQHQPDVAIIDLRMPGISGVETIGRIRKEYPKAKIIVLTTYDGDEDIYQALKAGAMSYLLKEMHSKEVLAAVRSVYAGQQLIPPQVAARVNERIPLSDLSSREQEVLNLIVRGLSNREIASILAVTENTVKFHIKSILGKLGVSDRTQAVISAIQRGIVHLD